jgi:hypothetical protein
MNMNGKNPGEEFLEYIRSSDSKPEWADDFGDKRDEVEVPDFLKEGVPPVENLEDATEEPKDAPELRQSA